MTSISDRSRRTGATSAQSPFVAATRIPRAERYAGRSALKDLFGGVPQRARDKRNACIARAYLEHGYTIKQIAGFLGLHYSSVSVIIHKAE